VWFVLFFLVHGVLSPPLPECPDQLGPHSVRPLPVRISLGRQKSFDWFLTNETKVEKTGLLKPHTNPELPLVGTD